MIKRTFKTIKAINEFRENFLYMAALIGLVLLIPISSTVLFFKEEPSMEINEYALRVEEPFENEKAAPVFALNTVFEDNTLKTKKTNEKKNKKSKKSEKKEIKPQKYIPLSNNTDFEEKEIPRGVSGEFKGFMDYRKITARRSKQWELQQKSKTDSDGFRRYNGLYMVALGSYYGPEVGMEFEIMLSTGKVIKCITGDVKDNRHTDPTNRYVAECDSIIEFIVDTEKIDSMTRIMGDMSHSGMDGSVIAIVNVKK